MSEHLNELEIARLADGEDANDGHVRECARCANAVVAALQMKRAVREAMPRYELPAGFRVVKGGGKPPQSMWLAALAASIAIVAILGSWLAIRRENARELVDLHATIVGSANPIEVASTDKHTVKPWFEGKVPFAVEVPDLSGTPFRLSGGRVVFWRGRPMAYLLVTKGAHRISVFVSDRVPSVGSAGAMTVESWRAHGLDYVAVADVPRSDIDALRAAFAR